jgi:Dyp-type peroxidase family
MASRLLFNTEPIEPDGTYKPFLEDLQANILVDHGRKHAAHLFLRFGHSCERAKQFIQAFARSRVTSALNHLDAHTDDPVVCFYLSAQGYCALGFPEHRLPGDLAFRAGMKAAGEKLHDPSPSQWDLPYRNRIDAMILIAHNEEHMLKHDVQNIVQLLKAEWKQAVTLLKPVEFGAYMYGQPRAKSESIVLQRPRLTQQQSIEHFGYIDGISDPVFLRRQLADQGPSKEWDPFVPLALILVQDVLGSKEHSCGSYLVFRKLEQHVKRFKEKQRELAKSLEGTTDEQREDLAGALAVGRFKDGTPVLLAQCPGKVGPLNDFTYESPSPDPGGVRCPLHAHIRSANPRRDPRSGSASIFASDRAHCIVRRGIPYGKEKRELVNGEPTFDEPNPPDEGVGTLFMCFQRDIKNQFEFIQSQWINLVNPGIGLDPIAGQLSPGKGQQFWPRSWTSADEERRTIDKCQIVPKVGFSFRDVVTLKGGEYFFAPSLSFLINEITK